MLVVAHVKREAFRCYRSSSGVGVGQPQHVEQTDALDLALGAGRTASCCGPDSSWVSRSGSGSAIAAESGAAESGPAESGPAVSGRGAGQQLQVHGCHDVGQQLHVRGCASTLPIVTISQSRETISTPWRASGRAG